VATTEERPAAETVEARIEQLRKRRAALLDGARKDAVRKQHEKGKLTARERVELLRSRSTARTTSAWSATARPATAW
jgi:propionyl-CoA carboxylase beta chain